MSRLFGTDGIRGLAGRDLTAALAVRAGRAVATLAAGKTPPIVLVGTDTRASGSMLLTALTAGLCEGGAEVHWLGVLPTPAVSYLTRQYRAHAGIMISASHNLAPFNGLKFFTRTGEKLTEQQEATLEEQIMADLSPAILHPGSFHRATQAVGDYLSFLHSTMPQKVSGLRIAVDCANGAATTTAHRLFAGLGTDVVMLGDHPDGDNINEGCGSTHPERLARLVARGGFDLGVAFDGDADRCVCVDEQGNVIDGNRLMALFAADRAERELLPGSLVTGTVLSSFGFRRFCAENGLVFQAAPVGDRFVWETMQKTGCAFGGEPSGHLIFRDYAATGDGQLTALQLLDCLQRHQMPLSALCPVLTQCPRIDRNFSATEDQKQYLNTDPAFRSLLTDINHALGEKGWLLVRPSGTEPLIRLSAEGDDHRIGEAADRITAFLQERLGLTQK